MSRTGLKACSKGLRTSGNDTPRGAAGRASFRGLTEDARQRIRADADAAAEAIEAIIAHLRSISSS